MLRLSGRVVIITGAGAGVGRSSALKFAANGASVVAVDIDATRAHRTAEAVSKLGTPAVSVTADVSIPEDSERVVDVALNTFERLDVLHCNAGVGPTGNGAVPFEETSMTSWERVLAVNLTGVFLGCRAVVPAMRRQGAGSIVVTSSASAFAGFPGMAIYAASKAGVHGLVRNLALDLGPHGIRINAIAPSGFGPTNFLEPPGHDVVSEKQRQRAQATLDASHYPLHRFATPDEIAEVAVFLASDEASWITGAAIPVDGGLTARAATPVSFSWTGPERETFTSEREP